MTASMLRLRRILDPASGRTLLLSFTAGMEVGVMPGMGNLPDMAGTLAAGGFLTGAVVHAGVLHSVFGRHRDLNCGAVVDLFGGTWLSSRPDRREQICTLEHAVRVGADAVLATVGLGSPDEAYHLRLCGQIARDCAAWGLPLVVKVDTMEAGAARQFSATLAGHGARLAYELGADLVVVNFAASPAAFAEAMRGVDIPVLIGGGPHMDTDEALLVSIRQALEAGARGVCLSASLFWQNGPSPALATLAQMLGVRK